MPESRVRAFEEDSEESDEELGPKDIVKKKPSLPSDPVEPVTKPESLHIVPYVVDEIFFAGNMPDFKSYIKYKLAVMLSDIESTDSKVAKFWAVVCGLPYMFLYFADIMLRGVSQVYLANHPITGLCICIGLWTTSVDLLVFGLCGSIVSTIAAYLVCTPKMEELEAGLCG